LMCCSSIRHQRTGPVTGLTPGTTVGRSGCSGGKSMSAWQARSLPEPKPPTRNLFWLWMQISVTPRRPFPTCSRPSSPGAMTWWSAADMSQAAQRPTGPCHAGYPPGLPPSLPCCSAVWTIPLPDFSPWKDGGWSNCPAMYRALKSALPSLPSTAATCGSGKSPSSSGTGISANQKWTARWSSITFASWSAWPGDVFSDA